jgi:conjugal transfer pilus assembly protein TraW
MNRLWVPLLFFSSLYLANIACAKDLGTVEKTYPIKEQDFSEYVKQTIAEKKKNGELAAFNKKFKKEALSQAKRPNPVEGLSPATENSTHYYDPTIVMADDIFDAEGNLIHSKGKRINPLDYVEFSKPILFFDADNEQQREWVVSKYHLAPNKPRLVLVKGSPVDMGKMFKVRVYFDQRGYMVNKFQIKHTPALVSRERDLLRIDEIALQ